MPRGVRITKAEEEVLRDFGAVQNDAGDWFLFGYPLGKGRTLHSQIEFFLRTGQGVRWGPLGRVLRYATRYHTVKVLEKLMEELRADV